MSRLKSILGFITKRRRVVEPELEQSILRVSIVSIMVIYLAVRQFSDPTPGHALALYTVACFLLFSFAIFTWVAVGAEGSRVRKIVGIVHDVGGLTLVMYAFDAATAPFYIAFLWVIFGSWLLTLEYIDYPMGNHDLTFKQQKQILKNRRGLAMGFGASVMILTSIPLINFIVMPVAVAGVTVMWTEQFDRPAG